MSKKNRKINEETIEVMEPVESTETAVEAPKKKIDKRLLIGGGVLAGLLTMAGAAIFGKRNADYDDGDWDESDDYADSDTDATYGSTDSTEE